MTGAPASPDVRAVQRRALRGILSLVGREATGKLLGLAGGVVLARWLDPAAFGLYAMGLFVMGLFAFSADLGLAAALIQKPTEAADDPLDAVFTVTLAVTLGVGVGILLAAPWIARGYRAPDLAWPLRAMTAIFILRSLRMIPVLIAERRLEYGRVALAESAGQVGYWTAAVAAALAGLGVWSFVLGLGAMTIVDLGVLFARTTWRPHLRSDWRPLRGLARFGFLYKVQATTVFVQSVLFPALGGYAYGRVAVGYLTWAQQLAVVPLSLSQIVARVGYPALVQLRDDRAAFASTVEATLGWTYRVTLPVLAVLAGLAPQIVGLVYGAKWLPALPALYLLTLDTGIQVATGVLMTTLYSRGRIRLALAVGLVWGGVTWGAAAAFTLAGAGFVALAVAHTLGGAAALVVTLAADRDLTAHALWRAARRPLASALAVGTVLAVWARPLIDDLVSLIAAAAIALASGLSLNLWTTRATVLSTLRTWTRAR